MSHITSIKVQVKDLEAFQAACRRLGLEFLRDQKTYMWYGTSMPDGGRNFMRYAALPEGLTLETLGKCDHAVRVPGSSYELGLVKWGDHYNLVWDEMGFAQTLGTGGEKLMQAYAIEAAKLEAQRQGYDAIEEAQLDGSVRVRILVSES